MLPRRPSASDLKWLGGQTHNERHMVDSCDASLSTNSMKRCAANAVIAALPKNSAQYTIFDLLIAPNSLTPQHPNRDALGPARHPWPVRRNGKLSLAVMIGDSRTRLRCRQAHRAIGGLPVCRIYCARTDSHSCWYFQHFMSTLRCRIQHPPFVATEPKASFKGNLILICGAFVHLTSGWNE